MRLIDADKLDVTPIDITNLPREKCLNVVLLEDVQAAPTIDPVRHGRWVHVGDDVWKCSECGEPQCCFDMTPEEFGLHYCPNCGLKMDGAGEGMERKLNAPLNIEKLREIMNIKKLREMDGQPVYLEIANGIIEWTIGPSPAADLPKNKGEQIMNEIDKSVMERKENAPLTIEELREMDGQPVYLAIADGVYGLVDWTDQEFTLSRGGTLSMQTAVSEGKVYRHKPKE